jgi:hypothetical protein
MTSRVKFLLIFVLFALPTVASFLMYYLAPPLASANYGELLTPVMTLPEKKIEAINADEAALPLLEKGLRGKWLLVAVDGGQCTARCEQKLYAMRQSRLIQGREMDRVLRVVLLDDDTMPNQELRARYDSTLWVTAAAGAAWRASLPPSPDGGEIRRNYIYAVDPLGNVFMRFPADADIKKLSKDLQRVLKASQIG